jgi:hypothetical protein
MDSSLALATDLYTWLATGRGSLKEAAIRTLDDPAAGVDRARLRMLLVDAINGEFAATGGGQEEDLVVRDTRAWLLSALGRVSVWKRGRGARDQGTC